MSKKNKLVPIQKKKFFFTVLEDILKGSKNTIVGHGPPLNILHHPTIH